jgi:hypothetical protein
MQELLSIKDQALALAERFADFAETLDEPQAVERIQPALRQCQHGLFRLVVVGEIKKGKSSFINALLGQHELLPTASDVATSTVYKLMYGERPACRVFFFPKEPERPAETTPPPLEIAPEQLPDYGTEDGNPGNAKGVDFIGLSLPHPLLKAGLMIIDTPGLGGLFREHSEITWRYVPSADALCFVLDSAEAVASKAEMDYLKRLREFTALLLFAQTKTDLADAAQWQGWRDRNLEIIAETLRVAKDRLAYFPLSSHLKRYADQDQSPEELERSGFGALLEFIQQRLLRRKDDLLGRAVLERLADETLGLGRSLTEDLKALGAETKQQLDKLERQLRETKAGFEHWRTGEYPRIVKKFQQDGADLKRTTLDALQNQLDASPDGPVVKPLMGALRHGSKSADELVREAQAIRSSCIDLCSQIVYDIQGQYNRDVRALIEGCARRLGISYAGSEGHQVEGVQLDGETDLNLAPQSGFESVRNTFFGGMAGGSMATVALALFFPPAGVAVAVGQLAGFLAGIYYTREHMAARKKEEALTKLQAKLSDVLRVSLRQATQQFQALATEFERAASDAFEGAAEKTATDLQARLTAIDEARQRTRGDNLAKAAEVKAQLAQAEALLGEIRALLKAAPAPDRVDWR